MNEFDGISTYQLQQMAFRVTPRGELANWTATDPDAGQYTDAELREFIIEQLNALGVTRTDINRMRS